MVMFALIGDIISKGNELKLSKERITEETANIYVR